MGDSVWHSATAGGWVPSRRVVLLGTSSFFPLASRFKGVGVTFVRLSPRRSSFLLVSLPLFFADLFFFLLFSPRCPHTAFFSCGVIFSSLLLYSALRCSSLLFSSSCSCHSRLTFHRCLAFAPISLTPMPSVCRLHALVSVPMPSCVACVLWATPSVPCRTGALSPLRLSCITHRPSVK